MSIAGKQEQLSLINRVHALFKLLICLCIALLVSFLLDFLNINILTRTILGWDIFCLSLLAFYWIVFFTTPQHHIRKEAANEDPSRIVTFIIILVCTFASMMAVILLLTARKGNVFSNQLQLPIALAGMILSWLVVHTLFTARYAHMYYGNKENDSTTHQEGLEFPDDNKPDFLDFAYFSFVLGMTFQVSDVEISSKKIRRLALMHGLISFAYNTIVVALTINIIAGLGN